jgi:hypothetical protein
MRPITFMKKIHRHNLKISKLPTNGDILLATPLRSTKFQNMTTAIYLQWENVYCNDESVPMFASYTSHNIFIVSRN